MAHLAALLRDERLRAKNVGKLQGLEMVLQFGDTICGGRRLHEGDLATSPSKHLQICGIAIVMASSQHHTVAFSHVDHELKVLSHLEVCFFFAATDIDKLKKGLSLAKPATKLDELVFLLDDAGFHQDFGEAFDVQVDLGHDVLDMVVRTDLLQVCLQLCVKLMGSLTATLLSLGQVFIPEYRTVAIDDEASKWVGILCCTVGLVGGTGWNG